MGSAPATAYRFDRYTLDLRRGSLRDGDSELKLRRKSFELLCHFAANSGRLLAKEDLMAAVWPGVVVSDDSLVQCVREIRHALADEAHESIKTVPGRGYLFDLPVSVIAMAPAESVMGENPSDGAASSVPVPAAEADAGRAGWIAVTTLRDRFRTLSPLRKAIGLTLVTVLVTTFALSSADMPSSPPGGAVVAPPLRPAAPPLSIAVLPFLNLSGDPARDHLADALAEDITDELTRASRALVMSRAAAFAYKGKQVDLSRAGRELGVRYLVLGSMRRNGDAERLNVQLVAADTGRQLWAAPFEWDTADHVEAQNRVVAQLGRTLSIELYAVESRRSLQERPDDPDVTDLVTRGWALLDRPLTRETNEEARQLFAAALARDGGSVGALLGTAVAQLSHVVNQWADADDARARLEQAEDALERVLARVPQHAFAQHVRGRLLRVKGEPEQAIAAFARAIELNPNYAESHAEIGRTKIDVGRAAETAGHVEQALRLNPRDPMVAFWSFWAGQAALYVGDDAAAAEWLRKAIEANPAYRNPRPWLAIAYMRLGREDEARRIFQEYRRANPTHRVSGFDRAYPRRHPILIAQRERIFETLRALGLPE